MIIYSGSKTEFIDHLDNNEIDEILEEALRTKMHKSTAHSEVVSWRNSLMYMGNVLRNEQIPSDAGVALEYNIPHTAKRVDMIVSGLSESRQHVAVIIELKQWEKAEAVENKDAIVKTFLGGHMVETTHPSYQAWSYAQMITDFNSAVQDELISLYPCAYLHNYDLCDQDPIISDLYSEYLTHSPLFARHDVTRLREFIKKYISVGDPKCETLMMIDSGRLRPSKSLQDSLCSMMKGNQEFTMIDTQKVIYEHILHSAREMPKKKKVIIVEGGPGTGKSVLAINLMVELTELGYATSYVSKNAAPRNIYNKKLKKTMKKSRIDFLFKGSGSFTSAPHDAFDVLLVDEAHRLNEKSGMFQNMGENQIKEIINSARLPVFFLDEDQRVTTRDIGSVDEIRKWADKAGAEVETLLLDSQFRCDGSDGYLSWLDEILGIRETANFDFQQDYEYDFKVFDDPVELRKAIEEKNRIDNKSRLVAGYCWDWKSEGKNDSSVHDITIPEYGFEMSWNLGNTDSWAIDPESVNQAGCIHTCQGLEFDYVGVIIGDDLRYEDGVVTDYTERAKTDQSLRGLKKRYATEKERHDAADRIIRNTYKVLMTRGMKGCYVFCTDRQLNEYMKERTVSRS